MLKRRGTLGAVLPDDVPSNQTQSPTELTLTPPDVCTQGSVDTTFVSDISSDVTLGSEIIKANTTFCGVTTLVISLTTIMSVSVFAVNAILKVEADQLFDTHANTLSDKVKVLHRGVEMSMNELIHTYMNNSEQKRQVASDIKHKSTPITSLGSTGFFRDGHRSKDFGFPALVKTQKGKLSKGLAPTLDAYLKDAPHYAHIIVTMAAMTNTGLEVHVYLGYG